MKPKRRENSHIVDAHYASVHSVLQMHNRAKAIVLEATQ